jgi:SAM-dependent methyltransferase
MIGLMSSSRLESASIREIKTCPVCHSAGYDRVGETAKGFESNVGRDGGKHFEHPPYCILQCRSCDAYFKSHTLTSKELANYYAELDFKTFDYDGLLPTDRIVLNALRNLPIESRVLDFGCSTGRIGQYLSGQYDCFGVEVNESAAAIARARGIQIITEDQLLEQDTGLFDAILLMDVYEHLISPIALLEKLVARLKCGGILIIVTGNADAVINRGWMSEHWYFRLPGHLLMSSETNIRWLAGRLELSLERFHKCSHYAFPLKERVRQYLQTFVYSLLRKESRGFLPKLLRYVPLMNRALNWQNAPALSCISDHFVAILKK